MAHVTGSPNPNADAPVRPPFLVRLVGSGLFSGYSPVASGTMGSLVALALYFIPGFEHPYVIMPACFVAFLGGTAVAERMERYYGHDPAEVTVDEVVGMWLSLFLLPKSLVVAVVAFFVFRALDILKPFPARRFDNVRGGLGIMMDDVVAGFYTNLILHALLAIPAFRALT